MTENAIQECNDYYCEPEKDIEELDLRGYKDLYQLYLENCKKVVLVRDFLPPMVKYVNVQDSNIARLDLRNLTDLEQLIMDNVANITLVDDFIPRCTHFISAMGNSCKRIPVENVDELVDIRLDGNIGVYVGVNMPSKLSVFSAEGVDFDDLIFTASNKIFVVIVNTATLYFGNTDRLEVVKIMGLRHDGEKAKKFAKTCIYRPLKEIRDDADAIRSEIITDQEVIRASMQ